MIASMTVQQYNARMLKVTSRIRWFDQQLAQGLRITLEKRLDITAQLVRDQMVANISLSVERVGTVVTVRSRPGEFPRAETTRLMKDIFWDRRGKLRRIVGTSLDYGLWLEIKMDRSFLRRTLDEQRRNIIRILNRPITR